MSKFNDSLLAWYRENHRKLPWRDTNDLYSVWLSEILLQQTRVATALPYFERWINRFPNLNSVAEAEENELLSYWQGLGYYSRCRNFQQGVRYVLENGLPSTSKDWENVPGVGPYTAAAICSNCFGVAVPSVDGNFLRVFSRLTANSASKPELLKQAMRWANEQIPDSTPGLWNQAMMELGATVCTPKSPKCSICPLRDICKGIDEAEKFPYRAKGRDKLELFWTCTIYYDGVAVGLELIPNGRWWNGMFRFPTVESKSVSNLNVRGTVTHHRINLSVNVINSAIPNLLTSVPLDDIGKFPLPSLYSKAFRLAFKEGLALEPKRRPA